MLAVLSNTGTSNDNDPSDFPSNSDTIFPNPFNLQDEADEDNLIAPTDPPMDEFWSTAEGQVADMEIIPPSTPLPEPLSAVMPPPPLPVTQRSAPPPTQAPIPVFPPDSSEEVPHKRSLDDIDDFTMALGLWVEDMGITRQGWTSLLDVLSLLESVKQIDRLPKSISTFRKNTKAHLPLLKLRRKELALVSDKLPTLAPLIRGIKTPRTEYMYWFDVQHLFKTMLSSSTFVSKLHQGMADFVNSPQELWHSPAWGASIRTCSGDFAYNINGEPIFPSDITVYMCTDEDCNCSDPDCKPHLGRAVCIGRDRTSTSSEPGAIIIKVQRLAERCECSAKLLDLIDNHDSVIDTAELFLLEDICDYISPSQV